MLNYLFGKQAEPQTLENLMQKLHAISEKMLARSKCASDLGQTLYALVRSEAPTYSVYFERVKEIYENLSMNYKIAAGEQNRAIEDIHDIVIRYPILLKLENERNEMKKIYEDINQKYKQAKIDMKLKETQETLAKYRNARIERAEYASKLLEKSTEYMNYRQRFDKFVTNRSTNAWQLYAKSIERTAKDEATLMTKLSDICKSICDNVDNPQAIIEAIENTKNNLLLIDYTDDENMLRSSLTAAAPYDDQKKKLMDE